MKISKAAAWTMCVAALALASWPAAGQSKKPPAARPATGVAQPFDVSLTRLPPGFAGTDCVALASALKGRVKPKTEFETQAQYEERVAAAANMPILGQLKLNDPVAVVLETRHVGMKYDAEHQEASFVSDSLFVTLESGGVHAMGSEDALLRSAVIGVKRKQLSSRDYVGVNAFGARVKASETKYAVCGAVVVDPEAPRLGFAFNVDYVAMEPGKAQALKPNLGVLVVGRLAPPYGAQLSGAKAATIDSPNGYTMEGDGFVIALEDVWYFDRSTGEVITRAVADQKARFAAKVDAMKLKGQQPSAVPGWPAPPAALSPQQ